MTAQEPLSTSGFQREHYRLRTFLSSWKVSLNSSHLDSWEAYFKNNFVPFCFQNVVNIFNFKTDCVHFRIVKLILLVMGENTVGAYPITQFNVLSDTGRWEDYLKCCISVLSL